MTEMEKDKLLDHIFDQNSRLMAQLSGIQEELRLVREGKAVPARRGAARMSSMGMTMEKDSMTGKRKWIQR